MKGLFRWDGFSCWATSLARAAGFLLLSSNAAWGFSLSSDQAATNATLSGTLGQTIALASGDGVPDGTPDPFRYDWDDPNGSAGLNLGTNRIYTSSGMSFALDLGRGGTRGTITGTAPLALQTISATLLTATYPTIPENNIAYSGSITLMNVGNISMGGISTRIGEYGVHRYRGSITIGQDGVAGPRAGNVRVNYLDVSGTLWFGGSRGATGGITVYSDGNVKIQDRDDDATAVLGDILGQTGAGLGGSVATINIQHQGTFRARDVVNCIIGNWPSAGSFRASVTNRGDVAGSPSGTFLANNIYTYFACVGYNNRPNEGNVTISGYTGVTITGNVHTFSWTPGTPGGFVTITNIAGPITILGTINLDSAGNDAYDGALTLQTTGAGPITLRAIDLTVCSTARLETVNGTTYIQRELVGFNISSPDSGRLSAGPGGTIYYNPELSANLYLNSATYNLGPGRGTLAPLTPAAGAAANWDGDTSTDFEAAGNWQGNAVPANDTSSSIATFGTKGGALDPQMTTRRSVSGVSFTDAGWRLSASTTTNLLIIGQDGMNSAGSGANVISSRLSLDPACGVWTVGAGNELIVSNAVSGDGSLSLYAAGTLTLAGTNACGPITLLAGTLQVANDNALGTNTLSTTNGTVNFLTATPSAGLIADLPLCANSGTLVLGAGTVPTILTVGGNNGSAIFSGIVTNGVQSGSLQKTGTGTLTLRAVNPYNGATLVSGGTWVLADGGRLTGTASNDIARTATLRLDNTGVGNEGDRLPNTAPVVFSLGSGVLQYLGRSNTVCAETVGPVTLGPSYAVVSNSLGGGSSPSAILTLGGLTRNAYQGVADFRGTALATSSNQILITGQTETSFLGPWAVVNGTDFAKYEATTPLGIRPLTIAAGDYYTNNSDAGWLSTTNARVVGNVTLSASRALNTLNLAGTSTLDLGASGANTLNLYSGGLLLSGGDATIKRTGGTGGLTAGGTATGELIVTVDGGRTLTVSVPITNNAPGNAVSLVKAGNGELRLSGANTFTGDLKFYSGLLGAGPNANPGGTGALYIYGGRFHAIGAGDTYWSNSAVHVLGDFAFYGDAGTMGTRFRNATTLYGMRTITSGANYPTLYFDGPVGGAGGITWSGLSSGANNPGLQLSVSNSFTGGVVLNSGTLVLGDNNALGTGTLTINGGYLNNAGSTVKTNSNALILNADLQSTSSTGFTFLGPVTLTGSRRLNLGGSQSTTFSNAISDAGEGYDLSNIGNATVTLGAPNTFRSLTESLGTLNLMTANAITGGVTVAGGLLRGYDVGSFGTGTITLTNGIFDSGSTLGLVFTNPVTIGGSVTLGNANNFTLSGPITLNGNQTVTIGNNRTVSVSGAIQGAYTLTLAGGNSSSTLALTGNNLTYAPAFVLNVYGTLDEQGNNNVFSQPVILNGGTFKLSGANNTLSGAVTLNTGALTINNTNGFIGGVVVNGGTLTLATNNVIAAGGVTLNGGTIQSSAASVRTNGTPMTLAGPMTFGGSGALVFTNQVALIGAPLLTLAPAVTFAENVVSGSLVKVGAGTLALTATNNSYAGGTLLLGGTLQVATNSGLGSGTVCMRDGKLELNGAGNVAPGQRVLVDSEPGSLAVLSIKYDGLPSIDPASTGVLAIDTTNFNTVVDLAACGSTWLGSAVAGTNRAGILLSDSNGIYRLGGGGGTLYLDAAGTTAGVLTGNCSVVVGKNGAGDNYAGTVMLLDANTCSGTTTVHRGSVLTGYAQAPGDGSPFGSEANAITLKGGAITVTRGGAATPRQAVTNDAVTISGCGQIGLSGNSSAPVQWSVRSLTLDPVWGGAMYIPSLSLGSYERLLVRENAPTAISGSPGIVDLHYRSTANDTPSFLKYDASYGFSNYTAEVALGSAGANDIAVVSAAGHTQTLTRTVYALSIRGVGNYTAVADGGSGKLILASGGLGCLDTQNGSTVVNVPIQFGPDSTPIEGVVCAPHNSNAGYVTILTKDVIGSGGLTKFGAGTLEIRATGNSGKQHASLGGRISVLEGTISSVASNTTVVSDERFPSVTEVLLNGGTLSVNYGASLNMPLRIGPNGGALAIPTSSGTGVDVNGFVSGEGLLKLTGYPPMNWTCTTNTYSGGTYISRTGGQLIVATNSSLGVGDVRLVQGTVLLLGTSNIASTARVYQVGGTLDFRYPGTPEIGSLAGNAGTLTLGPASGTGTTTLQVGKDGTSTEYAGVIADRTAVTQIGALTKVGNGTLALYGVNTHTGPTAVSNGTLLVNGRLAAGSLVTVAAGATLGGAGVVSGVVTNYGTLTPGSSVGTLTVGALTLQPGSTSCFELAAPAAANDRVAVGGNLALGGTIAIQTLPGFRNSTYTLMTYGGTLTGTAALQMPAGRNGKLDISTPGQVNLVVSTGGTLLLLR
jgi:autotransporter-associated beta strand protein